jgi:D-aspartate ligase
VSAGETIQRPHAPGNKDLPGAIVIGSDYIALGVVRSLGRHGIPVWVLRSPLHIEAAVSRYARRRFDWPGDDTARLALLVDLSARCGPAPWTLYPTHDEAAALVARHHQMLSELFLLTTPPWDVFRWAYDKRLTHVLTVRLGIGHAWTRFPRDETEVAALDCNFPVILKPAVKNLTNQFTLARAWLADDRSQLLKLYAEARKLVPSDVIMIQELIPGGGETRYSFAALCDRGRPLAWLVARRWRQLPVDFGRGSTFVETVDEPEIERLARQPLLEIGYSGIVEVEFKCDPRNGQPRLLDINARAWGWHTLGRRAGADFPFLAWQFVHGVEVSEIRARPGVRWIRALTDIPAALAELVMGHLTIFAYLCSIWPPFECAIFALDDPLPALFDLPLVAWRSFLRLGKNKSVE